MQKGEWWGTWFERRLLWVVISIYHLPIVSFWQYFPHSSDCFPHSFSSQEFGKTSLWNKYHSLLCDFWKFVGKTHHSCKFLGHSRPNGLSWPKNLHSLWVFSSLIFPESRDREMIITSLKLCYQKKAFWKICGKNSSFVQICTHCECFPHSFSRGRAVGKW